MPTLAGVRVSARADYAIRALLELTAAGSGEPVRGDAIARAQGIPSKYLENLLADLRRARLIASQRGVNGGYRLARPASAITLADVIRAIDGPLAGVRDSAPEDVALRGRGRQPAGRLGGAPRQHADGARGDDARRRRGRQAAQGRPQAPARTGCMDASLIIAPPSARRPRHAGPRHRPRRRRAQRRPPGRRTMAERGIALRPHAKTHKSIELGRIQLAHGAVGLTVGNLGEAEVFAGAGFTDLFIAYPIWAVGDKAATPSRAARGRSAGPVRRVRLRRGRRAARGRGRRARRAGCPCSWSSTPATAGRAPGPRTPARIASAAERAGLEVRGLFTHGGHGYQSREATITRRRGRGPGADDRARRAPRRRASSRP